MTFTYTAPTTDKDRVRFYLADTDSSAAKFSDEEIAAIITEHGSYQRAVIACLQNLMMRVSDPNFQADWLRVDNDKAYASLKSQLGELRRQLGVAAITATRTHLYRADSNQTEEPDYAAEAVDDDEACV